MDDNTRIPLQNIGKRIQIPKPKEPQESPAKPEPPAVNIEDTGPAQMWPYEWNKKLGEVLYAAAVKKGKLPEGVTMQRVTKEGETKCVQCKSKVHNEIFTFIQGEKKS